MINCMLLTKTSDFDFFYVLVEVLDDGFGWRCRLLSCIRKDSNKEDLDDPFAEMST